MKYVLLTVFTLVSSSLFSQESVKVPDPTKPQSNNTEKAKEIPEIKMFPVHQASISRGSLVMSVPVQIILAKAKEKFPNEPIRFQGTEEYVSAKDSQGNSLKISGVGRRIELGDTLIDESSIFFIYLEKPTNEIPEITIYTNHGKVKLNQAEVDPDFDVTKIVPAATIRSLGVIPSALLIGGTRGAVYQLGLDTSLIGSTYVRSVLSTSSLDKLAITELSSSEKNPFLTFSTNLLFTNQLVTVGLTNTSGEVNNPQKNYLGELEGLNVSTYGLYYSRQLRLDSRTPSDSRLGQGVYYASRSRQAIIQSDGYGLVTVGTGLFLFPTQAARQFGTNFFEFNYDVSFLIPLTFPSKTEAGFRKDGYFLSLGLVGGIQPVNDFQEVQGIRVNLSRSW